MTHWTNMERRKGQQARYAHSTLRELVGEKLVVEDCKLYGFKNCTLDGSHNELYDCVDCTITGSHNKLINCTNCTSVAAPPRGPDQILVHSITGVEGRI